MNELRLHNHLVDSFIEALRFLIFLGFLCLLFLVPLFRVLADPVEATVLGLLLA